MDESQYLYCIIGAGELADLGEVGLLNGDVSTVEFRGIAGVVSPVAYKELESSLANIMTHQKVVELARAKTTALPVRFGVIFKSKEGVKQLLSKSYSSYRDKLAKLDGKDEYGVKMILNSDGLKVLTQSVGKESPELSQLAKDSAKAGKGTAYLLKLKAEETLKSETFRKLEVISRDVDEKLVKAAVEGRRLTSDHEQIVLNAAYLVERGREAGFRQAVEGASSELRPLGLELHMSGPWAPYSFC
ncbi:MAG: GvpL/GvpF family gas vesicle protein [Thaumarchaeota archaeon]|nr:GvpL/GvpF family gas vesicle protein [Nitrososphaerota archaeon]